MIIWHAWIPPEDKFSLTYVSTVNNAYMVFKEGNTLEQILFYLVLFSFKILWKFWEAVSDYLSTFMYQKPQSWELILRVFHSKSFIGKGRICESGQWVGSTDNFRYFSDLTRYSVDTVLAEKC